MKNASASTTLDRPKVRSDAPLSGLACPKCGCRHLPVVYTRPRGDGILRARECRHCGRRIITRERM